VLREEPVCRVDGCDKPSTEDDHIIGWSQREAAGLTVNQWHARSNHQGLCREHHAAKTQAEAQAGRQARRQQAKRPVERHPGLL
jgi:5-methylcytosine-specific restriction endonuclease McrA